MEPIIQEINMTKILFHLFNAAAYASPGTGHSHVEEDAMAFKIIGGVVIALIAGVAFLFINKNDKKK